MANNQQYVLMVEDDIDDRYITETMLRETGYTIGIKYLAYSDQLLPFLAVNPEPRFILLDYNAKPLGGLEVLQQIKANTAFRHIPVMILSDNATPAYVNECYRAGANSFITKPSNAELTKQKIAAFFNYWLEVVEL